MGVKKLRDFASFLDALMTSEPKEERVRASTPSIAVDLLDQVERLQSTSPALSGEPALAQYREIVMALDEAAPRVGISQELPSIDADEIAAELGLAGVKGEKELARLRRAFAMDNHPDRVPEHLRERAEIRMRVANMLIDDARSGSTARRAGR